MQTPKCPNCPSKQFSLGKITIGQNGSAKVIYCDTCGSIIFYVEGSLRKPFDPNNKGGSSYGTAETSMKPST
jgi:transcription elongation factor Elf1